MQKYKYLVQKMSLSNKLLALSEELTTLRQQQEENNNKIIEQNGRLE